MRLLWLVFLAFCALPMAVSAQQDSAPAPYAYVQLADPAQEAEAIALMHTLRCLTCQSQSIADSDAPMAGDMRHQVRSRIEAGQTPDEIRDWLVERYGDYVTYEPTVSATTWPLFVVPGLLILIAAAVIAGRLRRGQSNETDRQDAI
jgi:cytochrome c-type biogenesis protein CcmH